MKAKPIKVYEQVLTVKCMKAPFEMMRYDNAVPATEEESYKLGRIASGYSKPEDHVVRFRRFSKNGNPPTADRWKSFSCEVLSWEPTG